MTALQNVIRLYLRVRQLTLLILNILELYLQHNVKAIK